MQAMTYVMDVPKNRRTVAVAAIGGMLAAGSVIWGFHLLLTLQDKEARWFWLYVAIAWVSFLLLAEVLVYVLSLRVPFLRQMANVLLLTTSAFGWAGYAVYLVVSVEPSTAMGFQSWFAEDGSFALIAAIAAVIWILLAVRESRGGTLTLGDDGLTCAVYDKRWRWAWHELPAFELQETDGLIGHLLGRHVAVEGGQKALLTDVWNSPLDEVLASINERREQALAARRESGIEDRRAEAWAGADLPEIAYRRSGKSLVRHAVCQGVTVLLLLSVCVGYLLTFDSFAAYWARDAGLVMAAGGLTLLLLAAIAAPFYPPVAARLVLRLDGKGVTQGSLFRRRRWHWCDLSAFELHKGQLSHPALYFFFSGRKPGGCLESGRTGDSYDTPLAEIAAKLNGYRKLTLDGG